MDFHYVHVGEKRSSSHRGRERKTEAVALRKVTELRKGIEIVVRKRTVREEEKRTKMMTEGKEERNGWMQMREMKGGELAERRSREKGGGERMTHRDVTNGEKGKGKRQGTEIKTQRWTQTEREEEREVEKKTEGETWTVRREKEMGMMEEERIEEGTEIERGRGEMIDGDLFLLN